MKALFALAVAATAAGLLAFLGADGTRVRDVPRPRAPRTATHPVARVSARPAARQDVRRGARAEPAPRRCPPAGDAVLAANAGAVVYGERGGDFGDLGVCDRRTFRRLKLGLDSQDAMVTLERGSAAVIANDCLSADGTEQCPALLETVDVRRRSVSTAPGGTDVAAIRLLAGPAGTAAMSLTDPRRIVVFAHGGVRTVAQAADLRVGSLHLLPGGRRFGWLQDGHERVHGFAR